MIDFREREIMDQVPLCEKRGRKKNGGEDHFDSLLQLEFHLLFLLLFELEPLKFFQGTLIRDKFPL